MAGGFAAICFAGHRVKAGAFLVLALPDGSQNRTVLVRIESIRRLWWSAPAELSATGEQRPPLYPNGTFWLLGRTPYNHRTNCAPVPAPRPLHNYDTYQKLGDIDVYPLEHSNYMVRVRDITFVAATRLLTTLSDVASDPGAGARLCSP